MESDRILDCREAACPAPVVEVSRAVRSLEVNQVLEVLATDPGFPRDIQAFSRQTGHPLLGVETTDGVSRAWIRRGH